MGGVWLISYLYVFFTRSLLAEGIESTSWKSVCLSVCLSSLQDFEYRPFISSQDHARPHISYTAGQRMMSAVIWRCQWHTQRQIQRQIHRQRQLQSASKTQCMLYFWRAGLCLKVIWGYQHLTIFSLPITLLYTVGSKEFNIWVVSILNLKVSLLPTLATDIFSYFKVISSNLEAHSCTRTLSTSVIWKLFIGISIHLQWFLVT